MHLLGRGFGSEYAPSPRVGAGIDGLRGLRTQSSQRSSRSCDVAVDLPPEGTRTVVFRLAGTVPAGALYRLDLLNQPLAHEDEVSVTLRGAGGSRPLTLFEGPLTEDTLLAAIGRS